MLGGGIGNSLFSLGGQALGNMFSSMAQQEAAADARAWQSAENQKQRDWQSNENQLSRDFNSAEALKNREFQTSEREAQNEWNSAKNQAKRLTEAGVNPWIALGSSTSNASGTSSMMGSGSAASSSPGSSGMTGAPVTFDPAASSVSSSATLKNLAEASQALSGSQRVRSLLDGELIGQQWDNVIKRQSAAAQAMTNFHLPETIQSRIFVDLTNGFKNMRSMQEMDAHIEEMLKKAGLDDAQRAYIQFSLSPYMQELSNFYKASASKVNEEAETERQSRAAKIAQMWSVANKNNSDAYRTYRLVEHEIANMDADTANKNALAAYNELNYKIRNANSNYEIAAVAEQFFNVIQNSAEISEADKKHMKALADKAKKDANHANAEFWRRQITAYGSLLINAGAFGVGLATGSPAIPPMLNGFTVSY